jgi:hypothetical protein
MTRKLAPMLLVGTMCGLCLHTGERQARAVPNPCNSGCKILYAWWPNGGPLTGTKVYAVEVTGTVTAGPGTHTTTALPSAFATVLSPGNYARTANNFDRWIYPTSTGTCFKGGLWQSPQEVTPGGVGAFDIAISQATCQ